MEESEVVASEGVQMSTSATETIKFVVGDSGSENLVDDSVLERFGEVKYMFGPKQTFQDYRTLYLQEIDQKEFDMYMHWVCKDELLDSGFEDQAENMFLVIYHTLATTMSDWKLENRVVDETMQKLGTRQGDKTSWFPGIQFINEIYRQSASASPIRNLLVDIYAKEADSRWLYENSKVWQDEPAWHTEFLVELTMALLDLRKISPDVAQSYQDPSTGDMRSYRTKSEIYHRHAEEFDEDVPDFESGLDWEVVGGLPKVG